MCQKFKFIPYPCVYNTTYVRVHFSPILWGDGSLLYVNWGSPLTVSEDKLRIDVWAAARYMSGSRVVTGKA